MDLNKYQNEAMSFRKYPEETGLLYPALKLAGEAGEVAEKVGKLVRDHGYRPWAGSSGNNISADQSQALVRELGDVLWYIAACADELGVPLDHVASINLMKLDSRQQRGVLHGSGDDR